MRTKDEEWIYEAPIVKVIEVEVEKGFASSYGDFEGNTPEDQPIQ